MRINTIEEDLIIDYITGAIKDIPEYLETEAENYYFASCLLMPTEILKRQIENLGGIYSVTNSRVLQRQIAKHFRVPLKVANMRINEIYQEQLLNKSKTLKK